jgi:hypothetical protein
MTSSIIGGVIIAILLVFTYILGDRKGFDRGLIKGAEEMNKHIKAKYEDYVMLTREGFRGITGFSVEEYEMMSDMADLAEEDVSEAKVSHLNVVKDKADVKKDPP